MAVRFLIKAVINFLGTSMTASPWRITINVSPLASLSLARTSLGMTICPRSPSMAVPSSSPVLVEVVFFINKENQLNQIIHT